ncbi:MAG: hypothetical protein HYY40_12140 [Bacteroidetes bacterium]|nr:hypothetical protein [Bacteroidota bacterium]
MKTSLLSIGASVLCLALIGLFPMTSCRKKGETPVLPPQESFVINTDALPDSASGKTAADTTMAKWFYSAATVGIWNTVLTVTLFVPVASYVEALKQTPVWDKKEKKWSWVFSVTGFWNITYTCKLYGWVNGTNYEWEMYISQAGGPQNVLWYEGVTAKDQSHAEWTLYKDINNPVKFIGVVYNKNGDGTSNIKYTNILEGDAGNGGYIYYGLSTDPQYNAFYDVNYIQNSKLTEIRWNTTSKIGKVRDNVQFGDSDWHCWDTMLKDAVCP